MHGYAHSSRGQSLQGHPTLVVERHGVTSWEDDCDEDERTFERDTRATLAEHGEGSVANEAVFSFKPYEPERPGGPADEEGRGGGDGAAATGKR
jgi:hypothetical protein